MASSRVLEAVAVTAELCGRTFSQGAAAMFVTDLSGFPDEAVLKALARCRKEVRGVLTVSDVISRIDDGRPGADEAWAMLPRDEDVTVMWTEEMRHAWGVALPLLQSGEDIPARLAFKEAYVKAVATARDAGVGPSWTISLGHDVEGRTEIVKAAAEKGLISNEQAKNLLPAPRAPSTPLATLLTTGNAIPLLNSLPPTSREAARPHIEKLKEIVGKKAVDQESAKLHLVKGAA